jgi:type II secretory pathway component PulK
VAVLGVLAVVGLMVAQLAMLGQVAQREATVAAERSRLKYVAESGAGEALWFHLVDRRLFASRVLGQDDATRESTEWAPWMLDGSVHDMPVESGRLRVALLDATQGIDVSGAQPGNELGLRVVEGEDADEKSEAIRSFMAVAADYVDSNDLTHEPYGKERAEYEDEGLWNFPRDGQLQFREEVYWLEGWRNVLSGTVRVIPPKGVNLNTNTGDRKPFFSSSPALIRDRLDMEPDSVQQVLAAREAWRQDRTPLSDSLDPALLSQVTALFTLVESGAVTVEAVAESPFPGVSRTVRLTLGCDMRQAYMFSDNQKQALSIWSCRYD